MKTAHSSTANPAEGKKAASNPAARASRAAARVFLVDDHPLIRRGLTELVNGQPDMVVCGDAGNVAEAKQGLAANRPDVLVADLSLPGADGMELIRDVAVLYPGLPVLVLSMHDEMFFAERALRAGARGYIMKQELSEKVVDAIRTVLRGEVYVSRDVSARILRAYLGGNKAPAGRQGIESLSDREVQVFESVGHGLGTGAIASALGVSPKTVETYRLRIRRKLGLKSTIEITHAAIRWVDDGPRPPAPGQP